MSLNIEKQKNKIRIVYFIFIFFILTLVGFSFLDKKITKAGVDELLRGWFWSSNSGWISLNSRNCELLEEGVCNDVGLSNYGVTIEQSGDVTGEAWSENFGWVCFGTTCEVWGNDSSYPELSYLKDSPDGRSTWADFDGIKLSGWANVVALGSEGWIKLQGPPVAAMPLSNVSCMMCDPTATPKTCEVCFSQVSQDYGLVGDVCYNCDMCNTDLSPVSCVTCNECNEYGLIMDSDDDNKIYGWAWGGTSMETGIGWVKPFGMFKLYPWLETKYSNIYSQNNISAKGAPPGKYNATYCIQTSGILTNFNSKSGCELTSSAGYENIAFPNAGNLYTNILGKLDRDKIVAGEYGEVETCVNPNAKTKDLSKATHDTEIQGKTLGGKIYYFTGNLTLNKVLNCNNGINGDSGSGLVVVDGDLNIDKNVYYEAASVSKIKELASVGWIVKGDLHVDPSVTEVAGAFYVEGKVYTGDDAAAPAPLKIYGLMIASEYAFERTYKSDVVGAEQVIYDGRSLVNTPPGMEDLTKSLPLWREAAP